MASIFWLSTLHYHTLPTLMHGFSGIEDIMSFGYDHSPPVTCAFLACLFFTVVLFLHGVQFYADWLAYWCLWIACFFSLFDAQMCLFANCSTYLRNTLIMDLPLSSFVFQFFCWQCKGVNLLRCNTASSDIVMLFTHILDLSQRSFFHCYSFVMLCNKLSITTN